MQPAEPRALGERLFSLSGLREFNDREPRYELTPLVWLTEREHAEFRERYTRLKAWNHPPMRDLLTDISHDFRLAMSLHAIGAGVGQTPGMLVRPLAKQCQIWTFAACNAVYSYQEHAKAVASRLGQGAAERVRTVFSEEYERNWQYLLAYKLRRIFTHQAFEATDLKLITSAPEPEGSINIELTYYIDRVKIMSDVGPMVREQLSRLDGNPSALEIIEASVAGMSAVDARLRSILYPQQVDDLRMLSQYREALLGEWAPVNLVELPPDPQTQGTVIMAIDPAELTRAGMVGPKGGTSRFSRV